MSLSPESNTEVPTPIMTDLQDIASMIQVNEEATVSRTVMHAEGVRLVLFSFDKDEILSEHTAAMPVILHTLEGALEIEADGRTVVLKPGDVIHFGTRLPHAVRARALEAGPVYAGPPRAPQGLNLAPHTGNPDLV